jgi:GH25 family lysozyme M1 (1,4-beta-N-acetylmuramidase)
MLSGTDISAHNSSVAPDGDFCIIKLTQGPSYVSSSAPYQIVSARRKGELVGFYHYAEYASSPTVNANNFLHELEKYWQPGDNIVLDHEAEKPYHVPGRAEGSGWGLDWLDRVMAVTKQRPWVYSNRSWAMDGHCAGMRYYPWWGAALM